MNSQGSKVTVFCSSALILSGIGLALYLLCYLFAGDGSDYFAIGNPLPTLSGIFVAVSVLWFLSAFVFIPKGSLPTNDFSRGKPCIAAAFPIIGTLGAGAITLTYFSPDELTALLGGKGAIDTNAICAMLALIGTLLSIFYYALRAVNHTRFAYASVILGVGPVCLLTGLCGLTYFEPDHHMNAPVKIGLQLAFIASMLYLTAELRYTLDRAQPRRYLASACIALLANACALSGVLPAILTPDNATHGTRILGLSLLCLCNGIYIACRLIALRKSCNIPATPEITQEKEQQDGCQQQDPMASQENN